MKRMLAFLAAALLTTSPAIAFGPPIWAGQGMAQFVPESTFASAPASPPDGTVIFASDVGPYGCTIVYHNGHYRPFSGCCTIDSQTAPTALTSSTSEVISGSTQIPGGMFSSSAYLNIIALASARGSAGNRIATIRISPSLLSAAGGVIYNAPMTSGQFSMMILRTIWPANSIASQIGPQVANTGTGPSTAVPNTESINTASNWFILWDAVLASSNDSMNYQTRTAQWCE